MLNGVCAEPVHPLGGNAKVLFGNRLFLGKAMADDGGGLTVEEVEEAVIDAVELDSQLIEVVPKVGGMATVTDQFVAELLELSQPSQATESGLGGQFVKPVEHGNGMVEVQVQDNGNVRHWKLQVFFRPEVNAARTSGQIARGKLI